MYWRRYVPVARRRAQAKRAAARMAKNGRTLKPVEITGRAIATTFWGKAWCDNLERYSDFENRLPRGRTYVRNGSVIDLDVTSGRVTAVVSGSELYEVEVEISPLASSRWKAITRDCSRSIDSLFDLLQGRLSKGVMERLTRPKEGLFPEPKEIRMRCTCPDWAVLCKHAAAVLYGVGARLDAEPELLFVLRDADHRELIKSAAAGGGLDAALGAPANGSLAGEDLETLFGIELGTEEGDAEAHATSKPRGRTRPRAAAAARARKPKSRAASNGRAKRSTAKGPAAAANGRSVSKKTSAKKTSAKKTSAKKTAAKKTAGKRTATTGGGTPAARGAGSKKAAVKRSRTGRRRNPEN